MGDDCRAAIRTTRAAYLAKLRVQQLLEPFATAANPRMMELNFKGAELLKKERHGCCVLCRLTYQANRRAAPMPVKLKSHTGPSG